MVSRLDHETYDLKVVSSSPGIGSLLNLALYKVLYLVFYLTSST